MIELGLIFFVIGSCCAMIWCGFTTMITTVNGPKDIISKVSCGLTIVSFVLAVIFMALGG